MRWHWYNASRWHLVKPISSLQHDYNFWFGKRFFTLWSGMLPIEYWWLLLRLLIGEWRRCEIKAKNELFRQRKEVLNTKTCIRVLKNMWMFDFYHQTKWVIYCACKKKIDIYPQSWYEIPPPPFLLSPPPCKNLIASNRVKSRTKSRTKSSLTCQV